MQQGLKFHIAGFLIEMPGIFYYFQSGIQVISQAMSHGKRLVVVFSGNPLLHFLDFCFYFFCPLGIELFFIGGKLELDILGKADLIIGVGLDPADMLAKPWKAVRSGSAAG